MDIAVYLLFPAVGLLGAALEHRISRLDRRARAIERKLDLMLEHLGVQVPGPDLGRVAALLREGKQIEAIKAYRELTGAGLKEAKDAVERMRA